MFIIMRIYYKHREPAPPCHAYYDNSVSREAANRRGFQGDSIPLAGFSGAGPLSVPLRPGSAVERSYSSSGSGRYSSTSPG